MSSDKFIIPVGTQVVIATEVRTSVGEVLHPSGSVGVIVKAPTDSTHSYRVRFPDGFEAPFRSDELTIRKHYQQEVAIGTGSEHETTLYDCVIYRCVVGSRAYGLEQHASDIDRRGIYVPPAELQWSLFGVPEQLESEENQECYWELRKFIVLALKANPNVLECLYTPLVEIVTPLSEELLQQRDMFLSKLVYQTYNGYVFSQFRKLEQDIRNQGSIKWKHAMHLIRLLLSGIKVLKEGFVPVRVEEHRDRLLAIRNGKTPWDEVNLWRLQLHKEFDAAYAETRLPDRPDYENANTFLVKARRKQL